MSFSFATFLSINLFSSFCTKFQRESLVIEFAFEFEFEFEFELDFELKKIELDMS